MEKNKDNQEKSMENKGQEGKWRKTNGKRKEKLAKPKNKKNPSPNFIGVLFIFRSSMIWRICGTVF